MRVLIVTHARLAPELGAAQTALHLAAALRERGHDAIAWSPEPLPAAARWWNIWRWQRRRLEEHLTASPPFDLVDCPAVSISARVAAAAPTVARSVQPELRYFAAALRGRLARWPRGAVKLPFETLQEARLSAAILAGWHRARAIVCLGTHEMRWMARRLPWMRGKLRLYVGALPPAEQAELAAVRTRRSPCAGAGIRFLWIGRWVPQKGTARLLELLAARAAARPADRFTIAGCGPQAARDCPPALLASGRLRLLPSFPRAALAELLAAHDAGLFTSDVEGWAVSLNEMLESGLPVYATEAGGVEDLRPYFPRSLRPFPPPLAPEPEGAAEDLAANGYRERFSWPAIARRYEEEVLLPCGRGGRAAPAAGQATAAA